MPGEAASGGEIEAAVIDQLRAILRRPRSS